MVCSQPYWLPEQKRKVVQEELSSHAGAAEESNSAWCRSKKMGLSQGEWCFTICSLPNALESTRISWVRLADSLVSGDRGATRPLLLYSSCWVFWAELKQAQNQNCVRGSCWDTHGSTGKATVWQGGPREWGRLGGRGAGGWEAARHRAVEGRWQSLEETKNKNP